MKLLKEIIHKEEVNKQGKSIHREAIRGIIRKGEKILMIYSKKNKDYKFPGGGVERNEKHEETLLREVKEESGAIVSKIVKGFGKVIEYDIPIEEEYDVFKMTSSYYICEINDKFKKQCLDKYEEDLGFKPVWINIDNAIKANKKLIINSKNKQIPRWVTRETFVLEQLKEQLIKL